MTASENARRISAVAAKAASEKLGENIAVIDVADLMAISEIFVITSADTERQVRSIVDEVEDELTNIGEEPLRREGGRENRWVLLDYGSVIVHVQRTPERDFYGLDRLYSDCPLIEVEGIETPERPGSWSNEVDIRQVGSLDDIPLAQPAPDVDEI